VLTKRKRRENDKLYISRGNSRLTKINQELKALDIQFLSKWPLFNLILFKLINKFQIQFSNFKGSYTYEDQVKYIEEKFASLNSNPNKTVYIHETCATDTNHVLQTPTNQLVLMNRENKKFYIFQ